MHCVYIYIYNTCICYTYVYMNIYTYVCIYIYILCIHTCTYIHTYIHLNWQVKCWMISLSLSLYSWHILGHKKSSATAATIDEGQRWTIWIWCIWLSMGESPNGSQLWQTFQLHGMAAIQPDGEPMFAKKKVLRNTRSSHQMTCT